MTSVPWRVVIGRLGRLGHGELKGTEDGRAEMLFITETTTKNEHSKEHSRHCVFYTSSSLVYSSLLMHQTGAFC